MLPDLIHHVRQELKSEQIARTVYMYVQNLHDNSLAPSIQTMCAKLLLNLVDCIVNQPNKEDVRRTIVLLLDAFTGKFTALTVVIPKLERRFQKISLASTGDQSMAEFENLVDLEHLAPVRISSLGLDHDQPDIVKGNI
jgi:transformation/transcription domain-associated protein